MGYKFLTPERHPMHLLKDIPAEFYVLALAFGALLSISLAVSC
jgi:hypothetical protein